MDKDEPLLKNSKGAQLEGLKIRWSTEDTATAPQPTMAISRNSNGHLNVCEQKDAGS